MMTLDFLARRMGARWFPVMPVLALLIFLIPQPSAAQDGLTEAKKMVDGVIAAIEENGWPDALLVSGPRNWVRRDEDLYVFIVNTRGTIVFHPNRTAIGINVSGARDQNGHAYMMDLLQQLDSEGATGLVEYQWPRPSDGKVSLKRTYAKRIGNFIVACGVYVEDI